MKRITSLVLIFVLALSLFACGGEGGNSGGDERNPAAPPAIEDSGLLVESAVDGVSVRAYGKDGKVERIQAGDAIFDIASEPIGDGKISVYDANLDGKSDFSFGEYGEAHLFLAGEMGSFADAGKIKDLYSGDATSYYTEISDGNEYFNYFKKASDGSVSHERVSLTETPEFKTDLSAYEQYMAPQDRDAYLILVNSENTIDATYVPERLTDLVDTRGDRAAQQMTETAARALEALYIEMRAAGYSDVSVTSAYRSYQRQEEVFNMYLQMNLNNGYDYDTAFAMVASDTALPGSSEHQTGLCCDMHNLPSASQAFADQPAYKWLSENAWKFGFILRYPSDKEDVTKITFEPWHYRFVGRYHAAKIHAMGVCFEEYCEMS